jgi:hypothetical protein
MKNVETKKVFTSVEVMEVPYEVQVPVYKKVEKPEYVLVKEEIVYKVPKIEYENKTYERPVYNEKVYEVPVYKERIYEIPKYVEKVYEIPKFVEKIIEVPKIREVEQLKIIEKEVEVQIPKPKFIVEEKHVVNAIIEDRPVTNAVIQHTIVEAIHPKYLCAKCKKEPV